MKYKLLGFLVNGEVAVFTGTGLSFIEKPVLIAEETTPIPNGYVDITSITNWEGVGLTYAESIGLDHLFVHDRIQETGEFIVRTNLAIFNDPSAIIVQPSIGDRVIVGDTPTGDFAGQAGRVATYAGSSWIFDPVYNHIIDFVPEIEKRILIAHNIGLVSKFLNYVTVEEMNEQHAIEYQNGVESRQFRMRWATGYVNAEIPSLIGTVIGNLLNSPIGDLHKMYLDFHVVGTQENDPVVAPGIIDYLLGRSIFTGNGLIDENFTPVTPGLTKQQFLDNLTQMLITGKTYYESDII